MALPSDYVAQSARRAQFRVVREPSLAKIRAVGEAGESRQEASGAAPRKTSRAKTKAMPGAPPPPRSLGLAGDVPSQFLFYRRTVKEIGMLVAQNDAEDRDGFFYCMKLMYMLGLTADDVVTQLRFTPETIIRWINGSRAPHIEMRQYILEKCYGILCKIADQSPPREFVRLGDRPDSETGADTR